MSKTSIPEKIENLINRTEEKINGKITQALLALSILIPLIHLSLITSQLSMPWWSDPGEWLMYTHAIEAALQTLITPHDPTIEQKLYPMWNIGPWQYPPLLFIIIMLIKKILGPIQTLKTIGIILYSLQPLPIYLIAKKITRYNIAALTAAYASIMPIYSEMYGWGGYPNLLGFIMLALVYYTILLNIDQPTKKNYITLIILSTLLPLTHHLTYGIYLGTTTLWMLLLLLHKNRTKIKPIAISLIISIITFTIYRLTLAYPLQFITYNEAAYYELRFDPLSTIPWVFKSPIPIILTILIIIILFIGTYKSLKYEHITLLTSWTLFPIMATQGYLLGIAIDYNRIFYFTLQPIPLIIAAPLSYIKQTNNNNTKMLRKITKTQKTILSIILIILSITTSINTFILGLQTINNVASWIPTQDPYGNQAKLAALNWIKQNTPSNATFIADELIGKWISGYAERRVYMYAEPRFLYLQGQIDRYYIASSILKATYELRNSYLRIQDQNPYNHAFSPIINIWSQGEYKEALIFNDTALTIKTDQTILASNNLTTNTTLKNQAQQAIIQTTYNNTEIIIEKSIILTNTPTLNIIYRIHKIKPITLYNITLNIDISPQRTVKLIEITKDYVKIHTDIGTITLITNAQKIVNTPDNHKLILTYNLQQNNTITINITKENPTRNNDINTIITLDTLQLIKQQNITYIVIPRILSTTIQTFPEYQHLLTKFKIAYMNNEVIILKTN